MQGPFSEFFFSLSVQDSEPGCLPREVSLRNQVPMASLMVMLYLACLTFKIILNELLTFKNWEVSYMDVWLFLGKNPQNPNLVTQGGLSHIATAVCGC